MSVTMYNVNGDPVVVENGMRWYGREQGLLDSPQEPKPAGWYSRVSQFGPDDFPPGTRKTEAGVFVDPS